MKCKPNHHHFQSGFSLIELTLVVVIMAIAAVPILGQFTSISTSALINEEIQTASQLAQESAENIITLRRDQGFDAVIVGTTQDQLKGDYADFSRIVSITEPPSFDVCEVNAPCKGVSVTVNRGTTKRAEILYVLVNY